MYSVKSSKYAWLLSIALVIALALMVVGCGEAADPDPDPDDEEPADPVTEDPSDVDDFSEVVIGVPTEAGGLCPRATTDVPSAQVFGMIYTWLAGFDPDTLEIEPYAAEEIEIPDDTTYIFHLREGIRFHDGSELTAEDVEYTYQTLMDPDFGARDHTFYRDTIDEITVLDEYTIQMTLQAPAASFVYFLTTGIIPKHIAEEEGDEYFKTNPIGSGPYKFVEWLPGDRIVIEANEDYYLGKPDIDRITYRLIPEDASRMMALETGEIDMVPSVPPEDIARLQETEGIDVAIRPGTGFDYMAFNCTKPPFDDVRVRQAVAYAIDMEEIVDHVHWGLRDVATTPIIPTSWAHNPDVRTYGYDPDRARELLADAGLEDGFSFTLSNSDSQERQQYAEMMQYQLEEVGIDMRIDTMEFATLNELVHEKPPQFETFMMGWGGQTDPDRGVYRQFHSSQQDRYDPPARLDELLITARETPDQEARKEMYFEIQEILAEELPYVCISYSLTPSAHTEDMRNWDGFCGYFRFLELRNASIDR